MTRTIEVEIDAHGGIHPVEPTSSLPQGRALLTWETPTIPETTQLAAASLQEDWLRPEEDEAWAHLQPDR